MTASTSWRLKASLKRCTTSTTLPRWEFSGRSEFIGPASATGWALRLTTCQTSAGAHGVEEACVADLGGVLRELDIDPCDRHSEHDGLSRTGHRVRCADRSSSSV